ncbi:hypothetical protein RhiJN_09807 [Ceratobasidium sp. AG-Ba]|nr:hypothetical protein RhiJN_09807 [Ceratobasidium sp. AG-Ba]QRW10559.1 hypothetical protein RhiLY_09558 [Ceratobasidium sp. AG-Ba]
MKGKTKGKGKKRTYDPSDSDSDPNARVGTDVNKALDKAHKKKGKEPPAPAPRDDANSSESESSSESELDRLRAENAQLRAKFENQSKRVANNPVPASSGSVPPPANTRRIPLPEYKTKVNATKWRQLLGWGENKGPWLQCRAYTRRAISRAPLDMTKPWKQQDPGDINSAVALLVKRVPQLECFEKNWGALQLLQETFNHMRATFLANELSSGSENDNYIRKKRKKEQALKTEEVERGGAGGGEEEEQGLGESGEKSSSDDEKSSSDDEESSDKEHDEGNGGRTASGKDTGKFNNIRVELANPHRFDRFGETSVRYVKQKLSLLVSKQATGLFMPGLQHPRPPVHTHPHPTSLPQPDGPHPRNPIQPNDTPTLESLWKRASSKAKKGLAARPVQPGGSHPPEPTQPDGTRAPELPENDMSSGDNAPELPSPGRARGSDLAIGDQLCNDAPNEERERSPVAHDIPPHGESSANWLSEHNSSDVPPDATNLPLPDVAARSTTAAAALAAINYGVPVPENSKARTAKGRPLAAALEDRASPPSQPALPADAAPITRGGLGQDQGQPVSSMPKSPRLPAREQLPRKSKTQAKEPPATLAPKGKKRKAEQSDQGGGKKQTKKGESSATRRDLYGDMADGHDPASGPNPSKEEGEEERLTLSCSSCLPEEAPPMSTGSDRSELNEDLEMGMFAEEEDSEQNA